MPKHRHERSESKERYKEVKKAEKLEFKEIKKESKKKYKMEKSIRSAKSTAMMKGMAWSLLINFVCIIRMLVEKLVELILEKYWGEKKQCLQLRKDFFVTKSAVEIANLIKTKELTSHQVVKAYCDRMNECNPMLNAVIDGPFSEALDIAQEIDTKIAKGLISEEEWSEKPFLGVPFTTKDSTAVGGKLHTLGITARRCLKAKEDAQCVKLMKEAGAIIIATSSIPEINRWQETRNNIIGQTNNPYDTRRTVGGSSGGEGAFISSCSTAFGLGTDVGGSIRMPAFYCGIYGHKPSPDVVNTRGCTLRTGNEKGSMVVAGPMTRHASDLLPTLKVLVGQENAIMLNLQEKVDVKKLRYFYCTENGDMKCSAVSSDLQRSMKNVVTYMSGLTGDMVQAVTFKGLERSSKLWRYWMTQEPAEFASLLGNNVKINPLVELFKKLTGNSEYTLASIYSLIDSILPQEKADEMRQITKELAEEVDELLGDDGVLFYHSTTHCAPFHFAAFIQVYNFHYWAIFNVLHLPTTQVPLGLNEKGLPLGIQVVAGRNRDRHCIAVAEELEKEFGGWVAPFRSQNN